jgi:hypothetical protein
LGLLEHAGEHPALGVGRHGIREHQPSQLQALVVRDQVRERPGQHLGPDRHREHGHADELVALEQAVALARGGIAARVVVTLDVGPGGRLVDRRDVVASAVETALRDVAPGVMPVRPALT